MGHSSISAVLGHARPLICNVSRPWVRPSPCSEYVNTLVEPRILSHIPYILPYTLYPNPHLAGQTLMSQAVVQLLWPVLNPADVVQGGEQGRPRTAVRDSAGIVCRANPTGIEGCVAC